MKTDLNTAVKTYKKPDRPDGDVGGRANSKNSKNPIKLCVWVTSVMQRLVIKLSTRPIYE